ncbi:hypothetical protein TNCV_1769501 [Trichonephila clavipes]|nr:hypothetical protein TNCV_1769501 [Trichonephila clavipes]
MGIGWTLPSSAKGYDLTSYKCPAARGLLATDLVILNLGQVTRMTPELESPSPNYHQRENVSALDRFNVHRPYTAGIWWYWARTHDMPAMIRYLDHWATAAPLPVEKKYLQE